MSSFTDPLEVRQVADGDRWATLRDIHYWTDCADTREQLHVRCRTLFIVPAGFETDFASIPRLFWTLIGHPAGQYAQAAVLHDHLYRTRIVSRARADALFREAMVALGVPGWQRWLLWVGVRAAGWAAYEPAGL